MRYVSSIERLAMEEGMEKGLEKGMQQGLTQGLRQGKAKALQQLMTRRFGILPTWIQQRIAGATDSDVDAWLEGACK